MNAFVTIRSVIVEDAAERFVMNAFVVVELVRVASVSVEDAAVRLLIVTLPVKTAASLKIDDPLNTVLLRVGETNERFVAVPPMIFGDSSVVSFKYPIVERPIRVDGAEYEGIMYAPIPTGA